jgi:hypothetical protein
MKTSLETKRGFVFAAALIMVLAGCKPKPRNLGGEIHGFVSTGAGKQDVGATVVGARGPRIRVPNIKVMAKNTVTNALSAAVTTNVNGHFATPRLKTGKYQLCVEAPGFVPNCTTQVFDVASETLVLNFDLLIAPEPGAVQGRVVLADGPQMPCFTERQAFGTEVAGKVWLVDGGGNQVAGPVMTNGAGQYVLPKIPGPAVYQLKASCDGGQGNRNVTFSSADLAGGSFDVTIKNHAPRLVSMAPTIGGAFVRRADAAATVNLTVKASDPDGDPLHYKWVSDTPSFTSVDSPTLNWTLPNARAVNVVSVQVTDGKGGYAFRSINLQSGPNEILFSGVVRDRNTLAIIPGAEIALSAGGVLHSATSNANGWFSVTVPDSPRYVLNVHKLGYALLSRIFFTSATSLDLLLDPAQVSTFPGEQGGAVTYERKNTATVRVRPGTMVDGKGNKVAGTIRGYAFAYDLDRSNPIPGDMSAKTIGGKDVRLESYGAMDVNFTDAGGNKLQLAPGATADIGLSIHPASLGTAPATIPLLSYDEKKGYWIEEGVLHRNGNRYEGTVKHFSTFNADTVFPDRSCLQFNVADHDVPQFPFILHVDYTSSAGGPRHNDFQVTETNNGLERLPPNAPMTITLYPGTGPGTPSSPSPHVLGTFHWNSGTQISNSIPYPVSNLNACQGFDAAPLAGNPTNPAVVILTQPAHLPFITGFGAGDQPTADAYYTQLGVLGGGTLRDTFSHWKATNGFNNDPTVLVAGEANGQYFNNGDLQLGRDMHCLKTTPVVSGVTHDHVACYVSNYGNGTNGVQGDPQFGVQHAVDRDILPLATVAMEYDAPQGSPPPVDAVQFYVYHAAAGNNGGEFENPVLDSELGKFLPQNCMACHGGTYNHTTNRVEGASFLAFDVFSFIYDSRVGDPRDIDALAGRQEAFRKLNALVAATNPNNTNPDNPITNFINGLYNWSGCNVNTVGCRAQDGPRPGHAGDLGPFTPTGWQTNATTTALYQTIPRPSCRTCHLAQGGFPPDWTSYSQVTDPANRPDIQLRVCLQTEGVPPGSQKFMPHAEVPYKAFWFSNDPSAPAFLGDATTGLGFPPNGGGDRCPR